MARRTTGRSITRHHAEWLNLIEISGPFLSLPVLLKVFPQGLDIVDSDKRRVARTAYEEWESVNSDGQFNSAIHNAWIDFVISDVLELPAEVVVKGQAIPSALKAEFSEHQEILRPDIIIQNPKDGDQPNRPRILIKVYPSSQKMEKPVTGLRWKASPATRMMELLHTTDYRLGLVTNGEQWMLVDAPREDSTGFISWYASLWSEEPLTLQAFRSLLGVSRFFNVADDESLEAMLAESAQNQQEVTDQLGFQVRKAVEVLIQSLDKTDQDSNHSLLADIEPTLLYEAALTVMMRLVFLMAAEERGLLLLDDDLYAQNYAISTLKDQLRETADQHGEEILERRHDAWCRLLSTFRAVHGGVEHEAMRLLAYGGSLFDPDRYPFLEGRKEGTHWKTSQASPLPINNRTVLHLLEALQILQVKVPGGGAAEARRLSFRALDIEQIGYVYEGLLDHTAKRAKDVVLGIKGKAYNEPEVEVGTLEELRKKSEDDLKKFIKDVSSRTPNAIKNDLKIELDMMAEQALRVTCGNNAKIFERVKPFAGLLRTDTLGHPVVIMPGSVYVTSGTDRRSSGTHYTPRSLTEPIVQHTLDPIVYEGSAEGKPKSEWKLKSPAEILDIKVCDMAMGSGAFLVQACRYLSERLVEAWEMVLETHSSVPGITAEGKASQGKANEALIPKDTDERIAYARRIIADRCLYGVDINPLAVEMAKLSLWLITLDKGRPFTFLDHALKCGDSLVGISNMKQLETFSLDGKADAIPTLLEPIQKKIKVAQMFRKELEALPSNTPDDIAYKEQKNAKAQEQIERLDFVADTLICSEWPSNNSSSNEKSREVNIADALLYFADDSLEDLKRKTTKNKDAAGVGRTFQWPLEFPEVFEKGGFDAIIGNPPFMGNKKITGTFGHAFRDHIVKDLAKGKAGLADLCTYFFLRGYALVKSNKNIGLIATDTIAQGDTRLVGLEAICNWGGHLYRAVPSRYWPGTASVVISTVWIHKGKWNGQYLLSDKEVCGINSLLSEVGAVTGNPYSLEESKEKAFIGSLVLGTGFILSKEEALSLIKSNPRNREVILPYIGGQVLNSSPNQSSEEYAIYFADWPLDNDNAPEGYIGPVASDHPNCLSIIQQRVKPERDKKKRKAYKDRWWRFAELQMAAYKAIASQKLVLLKARVSPIHAFVFVPNGQIYNEKTVIFSGGFKEFAIYQSSIHEVWAVHYSPTMGKTTLSYSPTACVATFPLPKNMDDLGLLGKKYHDFRTKIMAKNQEGLTKTFNRYNKTDGNSEDIQSLRDLHVEMDNAVAKSYGWDDLDLEHGFHETKQGLRFTISKKARQEVLQRLLKLNHERYAEEIELGLHIKGKGKKKKSDRHPKLFQME